MSDHVSREAVKAAIEAEIQRQIAIIHEYEGDKETQDMHRYATWVAREILAAIDALPSASPPGSESKATHVCDHRCLGDEGHHAWPSPST